ncbi:MAG: serine protease [Arthrobacter sp.]
MSNESKPYLRCVAAGSAVLCVSLTGCITGPDETTQPSSDPPSSTAEDVLHPEYSPDPASMPSGSASLSWPDIVAEVESGVGQFNVTTCESGSTGTGFLIGPNLVLTAAHVVADASAISISFGPSTVNATVLGTNDLADIALVRTAGPVDGHKFQFHKSDPPVGTDVAALGFPLDRPFTMTKGTVSALGAQQDLGTRILKDLIQTDTAVNYGNSGGPLVTQDGRVSGVMVTIEIGDYGRADGIAYAVSAPRVAAAVEEWKTRSSPVSFAECAEGASETGAFPFTNSSDHDQARNVGQTLIFYGQAINRHAHASAFKLLTPELQASSGDAASWGANHESSSWLSAELTSVTGTGNDLKARVRLRTMQDAVHGRDNQICSDWDIVYSVRWSGSNWLIAGTSLPNGEPTPCVIGVTIPGTASAQPSGS